MFWLGRPVWPWYDQSGQIFIGYRWGIVAYKRMYCSSNIESLHLVCRPKVTVVVTLFGTGVSSEDLELVESKSFEMNK